MVTQKFLELAQFEVHQERECSDKELSSECKAHLKEKISNVIDYKVAVIKGFENLYDFSSHPYVQKLLKRESD